MLTALEITLDIVVGFENWSNKINPSDPDKIKVVISRQPSLEVGKCFRVDYNGNVSNFVTVLGEHFRAKLHNIVIISWISLCGKRRRLIFLDNYSET